MSNKIDKKKNFRASNLVDGVLIFPDMLPISNSFLKAFL